MMAMAQLLKMRMPGSYEVTFSPQNPDMPGVDDPGKDPVQSGMHLNTVVCLDFLIDLECFIIQDTTSQGTTL